MPKTVMAGYFSNALRTVLGFWGEKFELWGLRFEISLRGSRLRV